MKIKLKVDESVKVLFQLLKMTKKYIMPQYTPKMVALMHPDISNYKTKKKFALNIFWKLLNGGKCMLEPLLYSKINSWNVAAVAIEM